MKNKSCDNALLSIIIISKDEEKNIGECIESVLKATEFVSSFELILVDSASSDNTIKIANKYPIKILQLNPYSHFSPSAGRYVGFLHSSGKYIQFIDGDMELYENWFEKSIEYLNDKNIAGISGLTVHQLESKNRMRPKNDFHLQHQEADILAGAALFKYDILKKVGPYNPCLYGDEEAELSYRLRRSGYKLLKIPHKMAIHHQRNDFSNEFKFRLIRKYYFGCGQTLRYSICDIHLFAAHLMRFRIYLFYITWIILGMFAFGINVVQNKSLFLLIWLVGTSILFISKSIKRRSVRSTLSSILSWTLVSLGIIIGFLIPLVKKELSYTILKD